jgi:hypothetical protein
MLYANSLPFGKCFNGLQSLVIQNHKGLKSAERASSDGEVWRAFHRGEALVEVVEDHNAGKEQAAYDR